MPSVPSRIFFLCLWHPNGGTLSILTGRDKEAYPLAKLSNVDQIETLQKEIGGITFLMI